MLIENTVACHSSFPSNWRRDCLATDPTFAPGTAAPCGSSTLPVRPRASTACNLGGRVATKPQPAHNNQKKIWIAAFTALSPIMRKCAGGAGKNSGCIQLTRLVKKSSRILNNTFLKFVLPKPFTAATGSGVAQALLPVPTVRSSRYEHRLGVPVLLG